MPDDSPTMPEAGAVRPSGVLARLDSVSVSFDGRSVLHEVSLAIESGEIVTLIGPNGSGKTTLVRVLLGLVEPKAGSVTRKAGLTIGYVPQHLYVEPTLPLTVGRFLSLCAPKAARRGAALTGALAEVGADGLLGSPFQTLSGGELKRVLLAQALLRQPDLLVLDEPSAGVDVTGQDELYGLLRQIRARRGCGVLLVSHDLHLVMAATDRVVCLNHHVCCTGRPEAVSQHPEYLALFGRRLTESLAVYTHHHDHHHGLSGDLDEEPAPEAEERKAEHG